MSARNTNLLTPLRKGTKSPFHVVYRCICGSEKEIYKYSVSSGDTSSCGCVSNKLISQKKIKHGVFSKNKLWTAEELGAFRSLENAIRRCTKSTYKYYRHYGGRGIRVCRRWQGPGGPLRFLRDMGPRPAGMTLERVDPNGHYDPLNCVWATQADQTRNTRSSRMLIFRGRSQCAASWAREMGINYQTLKTRLDSGWSVEDALTVKPRCK